MMKYISVLACLFFLSVTSVMANDNPIEVSADDALEWDRANQTVTATGNAVVKQGADTITAPKIQANYTEAMGNLIIQNITAAPNAVLVRPSETLSAKTLRADFDNGVLATVTADKTVVLKTDAETLYSDNAVYDAGKRLIIMTGNVRIEQDNNVLIGNRAEFDLNTNISRLSNDTQNGTTGGRVRAVFGSGGVE